MNFTIYFFSFFINMVFIVGRPRFSDYLYYIYSPSFPVLVKAHEQIPDWACRYKNQNGILKGLFKLKQILERKSNGTVVFGNYCILLLFLSFFFFIFFFFFQAIILPLWWSRCVSQLVDMAMALILKQNFIATVQEMFFNFPPSI